MTNPITSTFDKFSARSRSRKAELLHDLVDLAKVETLLDVGGEIGPRTSQFDGLASDARMTVVNIDPQHLDRVKEANPSVHTDLQDARDLPYPNDSFDLVFSNAVIEHVGDLGDQRRMADEVRRVGRQWFVTTPNRWFPFEFHTRLPVVSWLPSGALQAVAERYSYNHIHHRYQSNPGRERLRLLTARELQSLFPDSTIHRVRVTAWPETLVAVGPR